MFDEEKEFQESMSWCEEELHMKENTLYGDYDDTNYCETDYNEEERYLYMNTP